MAKISKYGGPSYTDREKVGRDFPRVVVTGVEEGDGESVGNSSEASPESTPKQNDRQSPSHPQPAPTTENPSTPNPPVADSSAHTTGGSGRKTQPQPSGKRRSGSF